MCSIKESLSIWPFNTLLATDCFCLCLSPVQIMSHKKLEQRTNIKFLVKLGKSPIESYGMLRQAYGEAMMSRASVYKWHKRFCDGRDVVQDDPKSGRPLTIKTEANIQRVKDLMKSDDGLTIRIMAKRLSLNKESVRKILVEELNVRRNRKVKEKKSGKTQSYGGMLRENSSDRGDYLQANLKPSTLKKTMGKDQNTID